ncbi:MAG: DEAD/DEAH box helicase [Clostridium sp.]|jgi:ATP-dependent RNA helicase DeaD|nr:DEAD/DEAH box helicase [Clostridium sp.]
MSNFTENENMELDDSKELHGNAQWSDTAEPEEVEEPEESQEWEGAEEPETADELSATERWGDAEEADETRRRPESQEAGETRRRPESQEAGETRRRPESQEAGEARRRPESQEADEARRRPEIQESDDGGELDLEELLDPRVLRAIQEMGFEKMTPIQESAIPALLNGRDIIGQAQTGTGKTAAFGIPMIQMVDPQLRRLQAIILCPTRELAIQASAELRNIAKYMEGIKILPVYGGQEISRQISGLRGAQIVVGTPGRVMDHMRRHTLKLDDISMVVLDEADEMLNMGFLEDMELILGEITQEHQTALFSATMPRPILNITGKFQKDAKMIKVTPEELTIPLVSQRYYRIKNKDKDAACIRLLDYYQPKLCLIFCNTKMKVDELAESLKKAGFHAEALHGDMSQHMRDAAMNRFRNGVTNILIATDVAARGIDVYDVEAVINYDIPQDIEYYVHRIGRTGRAGRTGRSFTFVSGREIYRVRDIERFCRTTIEEKRMPGASKVMRAKAEKLLDQVWELRQDADMELMKKYLSRKLEAEDCDAMELAAALLKHYVGNVGEEIEVDDFETKRFGRGRDSRGGRGDGFGSRRSGRRDPRSGREDRGFGSRREDRGFGSRREDRGFGDRREDGFEGRREDRGFGDRREDRGFGDRREDRGFGDRREDRGFGSRREDGFEGRREDGFGGTRREDGYRSARREDGLGSARRNDDLGGRRDSGSSREDGFGSRRRDDRETKRPFSHEERGREERGRRSIPFPLKKK